MNLPPRWVQTLIDAGHEVIHWSGVGPSGAPDTEVIMWARTHDYVVLTSDLDFAAILASTGGRVPSVVSFA